MVTFAMSVAEDSRYLQLIQSKAAQFDMNGCGLSWSGIIQLGLELNKHELKLIQDELDLMKLSVFNRNLSGNNMNLRIIS